MFWWIYLIYGIAFCIGAALLLHYSHFRCLATDFRITYRLVPGLVGEGPVVISLLKRSGLEARLPRSHTSAPDG